MNGTVMERDLQYRLGLTFIPGIGSVLAKNLLSYCGGAEQVFQTSSGRLAKIPGIGPAMVKAIRDPGNLDRANRELEFIHKHEIRPLFFTDPGFPVRLRNCSDCPVLLYYRGNADLNHKRVISVVGTRKPTGYGRQFVKRLLEELKALDVLVVSGLAYGIDIAAHRAALSQGMPTVGVLGHGLHWMYPSEHSATARQMTAQGGLLTEFSSQDEMVPQNFPRRNRVVAGICDAVVVVETGEKGGSMITANIANSYDRDVFALPGRVSDMRSSGCNSLIKQHKAAMIEDAQDLVAAMGWDARQVQTNVQRQLLLELTENEQQLVDFIRENDGMEVDDMHKRMRLSPGTIASTLVELEMKGIICSLPGKKFKLA